MSYKVSLGKNMICPICSKGFLVGDLVERVEVQTPSTYRSEAWIHKECGDKFGASDLEFKEKGQVKKDENV